MAENSTQEGVHMEEDPNEVSRVRVTETSVTFNVSVTETVIEREMDETRVSDGGSGFLEPRVYGSDFGVKGVTNEAEELGDEGSGFVNRGGEEKAGGGHSMPHDGSVPEIEETRAVNDVMKVECSLESSLNVSSEDIGVVDPVPYQRGTVSNLNGDVRVSSLETNGTSSTQDEKQETVVLGDEAVFNTKVEGNEEVGLHPIEGYLSRVTSVEVGTGLVTCGQKNHSVQVGEGTIGLGKQVENQLMGSHGDEVGVSQFVGNGSNLGSLTVDLVMCPTGDESENSGDEIGEEDIILSDERRTEDFGIKETRSGEEFFPFGPLGEIAADHATEAGTNGKEMMGLSGSNGKVKKTAKQAGSWPGASKVEEGEFSVSDLVWGKVKSHPWWPGQIFDPSDASKLAMRYHKKDRLFVAYFGDQTFAWNPVSSLKPFGAHFSRMEKQTDLEAFRHAVDCSLDEISRRAQLGLTCTCTPGGTYDKIKSQIIKNTGIQAEASRRDGVDKNMSATSFEPGKLVKYVKSLALKPFGKVDRLELVVSQARVRAFYCSKGYLQLPAFIMYGGLLEIDAENVSPVCKDEDQAPQGEQNLKNEELSDQRQSTSDDGLDSSTKERSLSELMGRKKASNKSASSYSGKKRKDVDCSSDDFAGDAKKQRLTGPGYVDTESQSPGSIKVGETMRKIAKQLTGSPLILNGQGGNSQKSEVKADQSGEKLDELERGGSSHTAKGSRGRKKTIPKEYPSADEMLSQLLLAARDPMKGYSFVTIVVGFFTEYRNSISLELATSGKRKRPQKKRGKSGAKNGKQSNSKTSSTETSDYEDINDSYWSDRIIQSSSEEQPSHKKRRRKQGSQHESAVKKDCSDTVEPTNHSQLNLTADSVYRPAVPENFSPKDLTVHSRQEPDGNSNMVVENPVGSSDENTVEDLSPTALILNFTDAESIPSEMHLNKIFSRFGPLKESETEVMRKTSRARVVFRRRDDAEAAFSSAGKYSIFGPALASYQLRYLPSTPSKAASCLTTPGKKDTGSLEGDTT